MSRRGQKRKQSIVKEEMADDTSDDDNSPHQIKKAPSPATPIRETKALLL